MAVSRDPIVILHIVRERDCYKPIDNLVKRQRRASARFCSNVLHPSLFNISVTEALLSKLPKVQQSALRWTISILEICSLVCGSHSAEAYSNWGLTMVF